VVVVLLLLLLVVVLVVVGLLVLVVVLLLLLLLLLLVLLVHMLTDANTIVFCLHQLKSCSDFTLYWSNHHHSAHTPPFSPTALKLDWTV
jgi:hypothetical protein